MAFDAFWLLYLRAHARPATRVLHYVGTSLSLVCLLLAAVLREWLWVPMAPLIGYGFAWGAHLGIEGNRPQTFGHPFFSLISDLRMLGLAFTRRLGPELLRAEAALPARTVR